MLELKPRPRRRAGRKCRLLLMLKVKSETATRFAALAEAEGVCLHEFLKHMRDVYDEASRKR
jgi:hypothetical protein